MQKKSRYPRARNIFLVLFLVSSCILVLVTFFSAQSYAAPLPGSSGTDAVTLGTLVATVTSCITSIVTFIGFLSTTLLTWRKEARDKEDRDLERKHKEIELEKERLELEKLRVEHEKLIKKKAE
jgi:hypothetical protein